MRLIFIRHGDPDYIHGSMNERGRCEAQTLVSRVSRWKVDRFYCVYDIFDTLADRVIFVILLIQTR